MALLSRTSRAAFFYICALILGLLSAFFIFYTARLLYVTSGLTETRSGGQGAYIGAVCFPIQAILLGWGAWRCIRAVRRL